MMKKNNASITELPLGKIFPNPDQPRKDFDQEKLEELAMSIKEYGVLEPIVVTPRADRFMIIAGERRYRASLLAGLDAIPARVIEADDALVEELALLENIQRQDLNIIEEGKAYRRLLDRGWTVEELAKKLGYKKTGPIYDRLSLLNLKPEYQELVIKGALAPLQAYEISRLPEGQQDVVYQKIVKGELNTYNKLYAFVTAMINLETQGQIFALAPLSEEERSSISTFDNLLGSVEKFIRRVYEQDKAAHLQKAVFHSGINGERLDHIIHSLQKIRRTVLAGEGVKKAMKEKAA
jgi:ParB family transcriptional regulator, chromosome partitioning protein